jgi:AcrR family transcriptional regulator
MDLGRRLPAASPRRVRTRPTRSQTRERILQAALEVFSARGIAAASVNDVAAAAGMTKGAVYSSFASKDELVLAMMEEHALQRLNAALAGFEETTDVHAAIGKVGTVLINAIHTDAAWHRLLAEYFALSYRDPERRAELRRRRRDARDTVARALTRLAEAGSVELPLPAADLAVVVLALSNGLGIEAGMDPDAVPDDLITRVFELLLRDMLTDMERRRTP